MAPQQRNPTLEWAPWFEFTDKDHVRCVWCAETYSYKRQRAFQHYGYGSGSSKSRCSKAPQSVFRRFANCGGIVPKKMTHAEIYGSNAASSAATVQQVSCESTPEGQLGEQIPQLPDLTEEPGNSHVERSESTRVPSRAGSCTLRTMRQQGMEEAF